MTQSNPFAPATREAQSFRAAISGPSGSGKTLGALMLARHLVGPTGRIAVIDTENRSASLYADKVPGGFDALNIRPPYLTQKYLDAINAAVDNGYDALVIDSVSHQWDGVGGILQRKEQADTRPGSNQWTNWAPFTKEHNEFRAALLHCPIHLICTLRSKMAYAQSESGGKKKIEKLGMAPIQREGMEYEFTTAWDVGMHHLAVSGGAAGKDRTGLFDGREVDLCDPRTAQEIRQWLDTAEPPPPRPTPEQFDELHLLAENAAWTPKEAAAMLKKGRIIATHEEMSDFLARAAETIVRRQTAEAEADAEAEAAAVTQDGAE